MTVRRSLRRSTVVAVVAALALSLTACADDDDDLASSSPSEPAATATASATSAPAFPVSIEHAWGTAVVESEPTRVLSLGYQDHDSILALGVKPIAVRYWFGPEDDQIWPWAEEAAGSDGKDVEILTMNDGIQFEKIAALDPDLIVGVYSDLDQNSYDRLSQIAPTIGRPKDYIDYGTPWDVQLEITAKALGKTDRARELRDAVEAKFEEIKDRHPEWGGKEVAVASFGGADDSLATFAGSDPRSRFFQKLGFVTPKEIDDAAGDQFYLPVSKENARMLDRDLLVWDQVSYTEGGRATIDDDPIFSQFDSMKEGRVVYTEGDIEFAYAFNSVLSLPYVLDRIEALIEAALDGDGGEGATGSEESVSPSASTSSS
ncbi:iron-siderophore ABC transporter substrate-binding protein [Sporichthya polymorpha]|uniref:iron-siderophore ABC transporter substrate-binding protein n=1 Tax=Sporichthya polymorpha TaxID=35751 RepID=UPI00036555D2|nr:iron-siderophore ABC transporter substrate-binding protein [Sporichthya polymorpha]